MNTVKDASEVVLPLGKFVCPICGAAVVIDDIDEWEQNDDGSWQVSETGVHVTCETEPDFDDDSWEDWHSGHWSMPYVDWMPMQEKIYRWLAKNYRFEMAGTP